VFEVFENRNRILLPILGLYEMNVYLLLIMLGFLMKEIIR